MRAAIDAARAADPLAGAKAGADRIDAWLTERLTTERGVHIESFLVAAGALAGFACQMAGRHRLTTAPDPGWTTPLVEARGADGRGYWFGDAINWALIEGPQSLWRVAAEAGGNLPDPLPIFQHVAASVGGDAFGRVRFPEGVFADAAPIDYLKALWPTFRGVMDILGIGPAEWPALFGLIARRNLDAAREVIDPAKGLGYFMESAVAMARVDPSEIG
jgi:hypothetical protein